jgi:hypothetical protein
MVLLLCAQGAAAAIDPSGCDQDWRLEPITQGFDYATDIQPVWSQYCANCHVDHAGSPLAGLDLDPAFSYTNLVLAPDGGLTIYLVEPFNPAGSLLFRKLNCNVPGPDVDGVRMPYGRPALSPALQALVYDWIAAGAPLSLERMFAGGFEER